MEPCYTKIHLAAVKIRGLAYLIESRGEACIEPEDPREIGWGISLIMNDVVEELKEVAVALENSEGLTLVKSKPPCK